MSVGLQKVNGVATATVELKQGRATLTLKPGNHVTLAELRRVIERNGFTFQGAAVVAEAEVVPRDAGGSEIKITGTNETFPVSRTTNEAASAELKKYAGKKVFVDAVIPSPKLNPSGAMEIKHVKPLGV